MSYFVIPVWNRSVHDRMILPKFRKVQPYASPVLNLAACWTRAAHLAMAAPGKPGSDRFDPPNERAG
ncbi:hypothetical protein [Sphingopyxis sp.]|uniref:hypothetical protein n=1 Tax=Sphingopyxis sp. TaxID=1908224 RepID=UPI002B494E07|nr:hypothetical protein [Sphingopyxis sp.]HJS12520.1 hypothetical protein [Sphingopyxis sp.]